MYSCAGLAEARGCPIRIFTDQSLFAAPRNFSQRTTSFIASQCQGIHQMPLSRLIALIINVHLGRSSASHLGNDLGRRRTNIDLGKTYYVLDLPVAGRSSAVTRPADLSSARRRHANKSLHSRCQSARRTAFASGETGLMRSSGQMPDCTMERLSWDGGARRDRTDDLKLAKLPLSQLSYGPSLNPPDPQTSPKAQSQSWWAWEDLNFRPHAYQARALTN